MSTDEHDASRPGFSVSELDYELPERLIAQAPAERREDSRLLVVDRFGETLQDRCFRELGEVLQPADLLVLNNTRVLPAKFRLRRDTGGQIDGLFLLERERGLWEVMLRGAGRVKASELLHPVGMETSYPWAVRVIENLGKGRWVVGVEPAADVVEVLSLVGRSPMPPYIHRQSDADERDRLDAERYQTVYARHAGAVAAPTAGLHFTEGQLAELAGRGIERVELTLHVGLGTFSPVAVDDLAEHAMHAEWYSLGEAAADRINAQRERGGRVVAVGTTSVRVLESCVTEVDRVAPGSGWTRIFCYPPYEFRVVDALLTNFHLPRSTLLALVMAFAGVERMRRAYLHAVDREYRFFSYGDAMLIG